MQLLNKLKKFKKRKYFMNKKMIMLAGMIFATSFGLIVSQESPVMIQLTSEEGKIYQVLVVKFQKKELTQDDNTAANIDILKKQEAFLSQEIKTQATKKTFVWPYLLAASVAPVLRMSQWVAQ